MYDQGNILIFFQEKNQFLLIGCTRKQLKLFLFICLHRRQHNQICRKSSMQKKQTKKDFHFQILLKIKGNLKKKNESEHKIKSEPRGSSIYGRDIGSRKN